MIPVSFDEINEGTIQGLVDAGEEERKHLEYKRELKIAKDSDKKEFCGDVSSFANAGGGCLIYGVEEDQGRPTKIVGITTTDPDATILQMESIARDGIDPRIPGIETKAALGPWNGPVIVMKVHKSWVTPHMVKSSGRFYSRTSNGKYQLDVDELRAAFVASEELPERIRRFRNDRVAKVVADEGPAFLLENPKIVVHLVPLDAFALGSATDLIQLVGPEAYPSPLGFKSYNSRINFDGLLAIVPSDDARRSKAYTQVFRNGIIEAVNAWMIRPDSSGGRAIRPRVLERALIDSTTNYLKFQRDRGLEAPVALMVTLLGVKGYYVWADGGGEPIDRDDLLIPEVLIEDFDLKSDVLLRPVFDAVWQAGGYISCRNYDKQGQWCER